MELSFNYTIKNFILLQMIFSYIVFFIKNQKIKKYLVILFLVFFSFYLGMRSFNIGTDTWTYVSTYLEGDGGYFREKGFKYLGLLLYKLNFSRKEYLLTIALLNTLLYYIGFSLYFKNKESLYVTLWIFIFNVTSLFGYVNILRQSLSGGFLLISLGLLSRRKNVLSILFLVIRFLFHKSMIFFIFLYFEKFYKFYIKLNFLKKILFIFVLIVFSFIVPYIFLWHYKFYQYFYYEKVSISFYFKYIFIIIFFIFYILKKQNIKRLEFFIFYSICIIGLFIQFKLISSRLIYYINIFIPIIIALYLNNTKKITNKITILSLIQIYHIIILFYPSLNKMFKF